MVAQSKNTRKIIACFMLALAFIYQSSPYPSCFLPLDISASQGAKWHLRALTTKESPVKDVLEDRLKKGEPPVKLTTQQSGEFIAGHPGLIVAGEILNAEQFRNFNAEQQRIARIVELVFGDTISAEQKRLWRLLLIGTVAVETNFLDANSGKSGNGTGQYQITKVAAETVIHQWLTYDIVDSLGKRIKQGKHRLFARLTPIFGEATNGKYKWGEVSAMTAEEVRDSCSVSPGSGNEEERNLATLMALLSYMERFERIYKSLEININPEEALCRALGRIWKQLYNTKLGAGRVEGFEERFPYKQPSYALAVLARRVEIDYREAYSKRTDANQQWQDFLNQEKYYEKLSALAASLLADIYGITPLNIYSSISSFRPIDNVEGAWYGRLKSDSRVNLVLCRLQDRVRFAVVVCADISQWATKGEKAAAEIDMEGALYDGVMRPPPGINRRELPPFIPAGLGLPEHRAGSVTEGAFRENDFNRQMSEQA